MKKNTLTIFCIVAFLFSVLSQAQCLTAAAGVSPNYEITVPNCNGQYYDIPGAAQASQYSLINVSGTYLVKVTADDQMKTIKVIKE